MAKEWVMVRVERHVHEALLDLVAGLETARICGMVCLPDVDGPLSASQMIARLIKHLRNDRRRMREAQARKRARLRAAIK